MNKLLEASKAVLVLYDADCDIDNHIEALRQALAEPYVPMTDDEITKATQVLKSDLLHEPTLYCWRAVEAAVLARLGVEVGK